MGAQFVPPDAGGGAPAAGGGLVAWTDTQDTPVISNDGGSADLTFAVPAAAKLLTITHITVEQIGGTYAGSSHSLNWATYLDAAKTVSGSGFNPFLAPLPTTPTYSPGSLPLISPAALVAVLGDFTFSGETAQYRVTLAGFYEGLAA